MSLRGSEATKAISQLDVLRRLQLANFRHADPSLRINYASLPSYDDGFPIGIIMSYTVFTHSS